MKQSFTAIDLFAGAGGLTQGLKQAGYRVIGAVEVDPLAAKTYEVNHPEVKVWLQDIHALDTKSVMKELNLKPGELDLLAGCPPCQGFSSMRTLNGHLKIMDERNDLIFDFLRFVEDLLPKAVMMENVPTLIGDERFLRFYLRLRELGYMPSADVKNVADYGVPQRRRRLILVAGRKERIDLAPPAKKRRTVRNAIKHLHQPGKSGDPLHDLAEKRSPEVVERIKRIPKNGGSRLDLGREYQLECHKQENIGFKDVYGRMAWDDVAPTITTGCFNPSKGRFLHPEQDRAITLREAALLQSFPRDYYFSLDRGKCNAAVLIGNALPPHFIMLHAARIRCFLKEHRHAGQSDSQTA